MLTIMFIQKNHHFFDSISVISDVMKGGAHVKNIFQVQLRRQSYRARIMTDVEPPLEVRNMTEWRPDLFNTSVLIPTISVSSHHIDKVRKILEKYVLKMRNIKPVQQCQIFPDRKSFLLSPEQVSSFRDLQPIHSSLEDFDVHQKHFRKV